MSKCHVDFPHGVFSDNWLFNRLTKAQTGPTSLENPAGDQHRFPMKKLAIYFLLVSITWNHSASAGEWIEGRVTHVRDVDTIEVNRLPIRLNGVDGPELNERGGRAGKTWMQKRVLRKPVKCELNGDKTHDRWVGVCYLASGEDIGAMAIAAGRARDCPKFSGGRYARFETSESRRLPVHGYCR